MIGRMSQDLAIPAASKLPDFGAATLYKENVARAGQIMPQNLRSVPKPSVANIYNQQAIQVAAQLPPPNSTPLSNIQSRYAFLPIGQVNKAGR